MNHHHPMEGVNDLNSSNHHLYNVNVNPEDRDPMNPSLNPNNPTSNNPTTSNTHTQDSIMEEIHNTTNNNSNNSNNTNNNNNTSNSNMYRPHGTDAHGHPLNPHPHVDGEYVRGLAQQSLYTGVNHVTAMANANASANASNVNVGANAGVSAGNVSVGGNMNVSVNMARNGSVAVTAAPSSMTAGNTNINVNTNTIPNNNGGHTGHTGHPLGDHAIVRGVAHAPINVGVGYAGSSGGGHGNGPMNLNQVAPPPNEPHIHAHGVPVPGQVQHGQVAGMMQAQGHGQVQGHGHGQPPQAQAQIHPTQAQQQQQQAAQQQQQQQIEQAKQAQAQRLEQALMGQNQNQNQTQNQGQGQVHGQNDAAANGQNGNANANTNANGNNNGNASGGSADEIDNEPRLEGYERTNRIGQGAYGIVYRGVHRSSGDVVAIKRIPFTEASPEGGVPCNVIREISLLRELDHPNVVRLRDVNQAVPGELYLIFEFVSYDLKTFMDRQAQQAVEEARKQNGGNGSAAPANSLDYRNDRGLKPMVVKSFMRQILEGIRFCHTHRILHRDLKPHNLLITSDGTQVKLADFGLARLSGLPNGPYTQEVVTLWYRAPELLLGATRYSSAVDVWSVGCIFAEMATGIPLFPGKSDIDQLFKIFQRRGTPNDSIWQGCERLEHYNPQFPQWRQRHIQDFLSVECMGGSHQALDLLEQLLQYDPNNRLICRTALEHQYFFE